MYEYRCLAPLQDNPRPSVLSGLQNGTAICCICPLSQMSQIFVTRRQYLSNTIFLNLHENIFFEKSLKKRKRSLEICEILNNQMLEFNWNVLDEQKVWRVLNVHRFHVFIPFTDSLQFWLHSSSRNKKEKGKTLIFAMSVSQNWRILVLLFFSTLSEPTVFWGSHNIASS